MMNKNGYKLLSLGGILLAIGALVWGVLSFTSMDVNFNKIIESEFKGDAIVVPVQASKEFKIEGIWDIKITQGPASLKIYANQEQVKQMKIDQTDQLLTLNTGNGFKIGSGYRAEISMPNLESVGLVGGAHITINGIKAKKFNLTSDGASSITLHDSAITDLILESNGASSIDADSSKCVNAQVKIAGTSNVSLDMNGGTLSGTIDGLAHLRYKGSVSLENVKSNGLAKVEYAE